MTYVICINRPGYLPEMDPYPISFDADLAVVPQLLEHLRAEVLAMAPDEDPEFEPWGEVIAQIERDRDKAADFDDAGFLYHLPDGYVIEATKVTSFKVEVIADDSGVWAGNALRFDTQEAAEAHAVDLANRWTLVQKWRVMPA